MKRIQIMGGLFTLVLGTLLHFAYGWSGGNAAVGAFSAVNESTWEHLKLLAMPVLLFGGAEYFLYGKKINNFIPVKALSALLGMGVIVALFYTYVGIVGRHFLWADIGTFVVGVVAAYLLSTRFLNTEVFTSRIWGILGGLVLAAILACFVLFTFFPPHIGLFLDPISHGYGRCP
ncbi:MAG: DUF6512 family protein [Pseudoflavonifractor sp.]